MTNGLGNRIEKACDIPTTTLPQSPKTRPWPHRQMVPWHHALVHQSSNSAALWRVFGPSNALGDIITAEGSGAA